MNAIFIAGATLIALCDHMKKILDQNAKYICKISHPTTSNQSRKCVLDRVPSKNPVLKSAKIVHS